ncbi:DEAD/DEAH box helicase [Streptomyces sp. NPDC001978]|uniref:DEAD/DEAH box helicase n=1 Tax=Streptomyces sp. NPDC001978 TaxID=3364627 RepID=UPI00368F2D30
MAFVGRKSSNTPPESPETLYRDLPRSPDGVPGLWLHQGDLLRSYKAHHLDTDDLALELPTGTGKTLPGLLIAEWVRRTTNKRVAYACPTQQLARQVKLVAEREGISSSLLIGKYKSWPTQGEASYVAAQSVAVTTYSTVFNSSPKLEVPDLLIFDDAHAGEQYVAEAYSVLLKRWENLTAYVRVLEAVAPALDGMFVQRLLEEEPDPGAQKPIRLVVPLRNQRILSKLDTALSSLTGDISYRYSMIRAGLSSCLVYVTYGSILVRPLIPPTSENHVFVGARQRIYVSATLGRGGELERAFGRTEITTLALPVDSSEPRSGRRFFLFSDLMSDAGAAQLTKDAVVAAGKALILAPETRIADAAAEDLAGEDWQVFKSADVEKTLAPFAETAHATCGLAGRYDGLDLPGNSCNAVVLQGLPDADNLQERFLSGRVRAGIALAERIRTRVVQGAGRCTRGPKDWALVIVNGADITKYLSRPETQQAMEPELQAELRFGIENSKGDSESARENVAIFLEQGIAWRSQAEPLLAEFRQDAVQVALPGSEALAHSVSLEVQACMLAWSGKWKRAAQLMHEAARLVGEGGDYTRGYRSFLLYLACQWVSEAAHAENDAALQLKAKEWEGQSERAAKPATWIHEMPPLPGNASPSVAVEDSAAVSAVVAQLEKGLATGKHQKLVEGMVEGLGKSKSTEYEPALTQLGKLLGAESYKPPAKGRCDSAWCWGNHLWLAMEAKSDHIPSGFIPHKDLRQANDQLRLMAQDRNEENAPPGSATIIISPKVGVSPDYASSAESHVHLVNLEDIKAIAEDVRLAWAELYGGIANLGSGSLRDIVLKAFKDYGVLPSQVRDRLTQEPLRPA